MADFPREPADFSDGARPRALAQLYDCAIEQTEVLVNGYAGRGDRAAWKARGVRVAILLLFGVGTLAPMLSLIGSRLYPAYTFPWTEAGYVLLATAGGLVVFDQFFGLSRSWTRYRLTEAKLRAMVVQLRFAWGATLSEMGGEVFSLESRKRLTELLLAHATGVQGIAEAETKEWADQFRAQIESFDQKVQNAQNESLSRVHLAHASANGTGGVAAAPGTGPARPAHGFESQKWAKGPDAEEGVL